VVRVVYLVFNQGYTTSYGTTLMWHDLSSEAIRLVRLFVELLPDPEAEGLLAVMLLHESRRGARTTPDAEMILLEDQDRWLWNRTLIRRSHRRRAGDTWGEYPARRGLRR
jgi:RNA polymerase sigma-70 factor, ECF subfamily